MKKHLIISIGTDAGKESKYFVLLDYLNKNNISTDLCVLAHTFRKNRSFSLNYAKNIKKKNFFYVTKFIYLLLSIIRYKIIIITGLRFNQKFLKLFKLFGKKIIFLEDGFNNDIGCNLVYDKCLLKGFYSQYLFEKRNHIKDKEFKVGCIDIPLFKKKNKIKNSCIFFLTSPQYIDKWYYDLFVETINQLESKKKNIFIKFHPSFKNLYKFNFVSDENKKLVENIKEISQNYNKIENDYYEILPNVSFCISSQTNSFLESNYFYKPFLFVERINFYNNNKNYEENGKEKLNFYDYGLKEINSKIKINLAKDNLFTFFGSECALKNINRVLDEYTDEKIESFVKNENEKIDNIRKRISEYDGEKIFEKIVQEIKNI